MSKKLIIVREHETPEETARRWKHLPRIYRERLELMGSTPIDPETDSSGCVLTHLYHHEQESYESPGRETSSQGLITARRF